MSGQGHQPTPSGAAPVPPKDSSLAAARRLAALASSVSLSSGRRVDVTGMADGGFMLSVVAQLGRGDRPISSVQLTPLDAERVGRALAPSLIERLQARADEAHRNVRRARALNVRAFVAWVLSCPILVALGWWLG